MTNAGSHISTCDVLLVLGYIGSWSHLDLRLKALGCIVISWARRTQQFLHFHSLLGSLLSKPDIPRAFHLESERKQKTLMLSNPKCLTHKDKKLKMHILLFFNLIRENQSVITKPLTCQPEPFLCSHLWSWRLSKTSRILGASSLLKAGSLNK